MCDDGVCNCHNFLVRVCTIGAYSFILSYAIYIPHTLIHYHCTLYYHVTMSVCVVVTISVYGVLAKCYKLRTRNEPVSIPHIVITIYERYRAVPTT